MLSGSMTAQWIMAIPSMGVHGFEVCDTVLKILEFLIDFFGAMVVLILRRKQTGAAARSKQDDHRTENKTHGFQSRSLHGQLLYAFNTWTFVAYP